MEQSEQPVVSSSSLSRRAIRISDRMRWVSGVLGSALLTAGGAAVFVSDNQAGTTALLLVGGLGGLMALSGRVPDSIGREGVVHEATQDETVAPVVLTNLLNDQLLPSEIRSIIAAAIQDQFERQLPPPPTRPAIEAPASSPLSQQAESVLIENLFYSVLPTALPAGASAKARWRSDGVSWDAVLSQVGTDVPLVGIEVKRTLGRNTFHALLARWQSSELPALVIVVPDLAVVFPEARDGSFFEQWGTQVQIASLAAAESEKTAIGQTFARAWKFATTANETRGWGA